jgi:hypothetical protein
LCSSFLNFRIGRGGCRRRRYLCRVREEPALEFCLGCPDVL